MACFQSTWSRMSMWSLLLSSAQGAGTGLSHWCHLCSLVSSDDSEHLQETGPEWNLWIFGQAHHLDIHWKDWCWSWSSNTLVTWCEEMTHWKRPWCWKRLKAGGEGDYRDEMVGWHHWLQWTQVWASSRSWWWTGKPGMLQSMVSQRVGHDWATELNSAIWNLTQWYFLRYFQ